MTDVIHNIAEEIQETVETENAVNRLLECSKENVDLVVETVLQ